jgi:hypothetical protein
MTTEPIRDEIAHLMYDLVINDNGLWPWGNSVPYMTDRFLAAADAVLEKLRAARQADEAKIAAIVQAWEIMGDGSKPFSIAERDLQNAIIALVAER